jgi:serine/threonine protein kinase
VDYYTGEESLSPVIIVEQNENYDKTGTRNIGDVQFDRRNKIGEGGFGTVFAGTFKGEKVAVKRVDPMGSQLRENDLERSIKFHQLLNHPNIVQFKHCEEDRDFR